MTQTEGRFKLYMLAVDKEIGRKTGLSSSDLADYCYRDSFDDEIPPAEVALDVLIENGFEE